jgi:hypothetical protein
MVSYIPRLIISTLFLLITALPEIAYPEYLEDIDTTDVDGYGLDRVFKIGSINGAHPDRELSGQQILACYNGLSIHSPSAFRYEFNEINIATADSLILYYSRMTASGYRFPNNNFCFTVVKFTTDSTFCKVMVLSKLPDNRYVYRYGINTAPKNRTLMRSNYSRLLRYKPNNLFYYFNAQNFNKFSWEPPLQNDNHLNGYIIYVQKRGVSIDTTAPINLAQWDSIGFTNSTRFDYSYVPDGEYFNIVAVYSEGKSDFLKGWSRMNKRIGTNQEIKLFTASTASACIREYNNGLLFNFTIPLATAEVSIFKTTGRRVTYFSNIAGSQIVWHSSQQNIPPGLYLLRAEFPDRSAITQPFTIMR